MRQGNRPRLARPFRRSRWSMWLIVSALSVALLSAACVSLVPSARTYVLMRGSAGSAQPVISDPAVATAVAASASAGAAGAADPSRTDAAATASRTLGQKTTAVRRGTIAERVTLNGRVAAPEEVALSYGSSGRVESVAAKPGQAVTAGQVLVQAESKAVAKDLAAARARLDTTTLRLAQLQAQVQQRQRDVQRAAQTDGNRRADAIEDGEATVRRAAADLDRARTGPSSTEKDLAAAAVGAAQNTYDRAQADLARLQAGPADSDLRAAEQQVTATGLALRRADAEVTRLKAGANPADVRAAELDVITAQSALDQAQADLDRLSRGADPNELRAAEREVERAQNTLRAVESAPADDSTRAAHDASVANARLDLQSAQDRLSRVRQGPPASEVDTAKRTQQAARLRLDSARDRYDAVRKPADPLSLAAAYAAAGDARLAAENAEARLRDLKAGPHPEDVAAASQAVENARVALASASARLDDLQNRPRPDDVKAAEDALALAQVRLTRIRSEAALPADTTDPSMYDLLLLQKTLSQDRADVASLEQDLAATQLVAPFDGVVVSMAVQPGDPLTAGAAVVTLAKPAQAVLRVEAPDNVASRLVAGQDASAQVDGDATPRSATILNVSDVSNGATRAVLLSVTWPGAPPVLGTGAQAVITLQEKPNVLLVPLRAVRSAGNRHYVESADGVSRRIVDVEVGITSGTDTEIVSGLREGQLVVVGP